MGGAGGFFSFKPQSCFNGLNISSEIIELTACFHNIKISAQQSSQMIFMNPSPPASFSEEETMEIYKKALNSILDVSYPERCTLKYKDRVRS